VELSPLDSNLPQAIYNQVILDVHFPRVVYKKLKYIRPDFTDMQEASPSVAHSLKQLLEYDGDLEHDICRTFEVTFDLVCTNSSPSFASSTLCARMCNSEALLVRRTSASPVGFD
jgi:hypothetical protein